MGQKSDVRLSISPHLCIPANRCEGTNEWTVVKNRFVPSKDHREEKSTGKSICLWVSEIKQKKITSNSSRIGSTSVTPQGVREESVFSFEDENNPFGFSAAPGLQK
ncbi:hypothetical protein TNCV_5120331 [Trichonephila clavipes]|nr:hypothetical protein TNCV_5120331 [Trichonephila clavipes]